MLVVVGIIGLLVALLVPGIGRAMKIAQRIRCHSQMQQIGHAVNYSIFQDVRNERQYYPSRIEWPMEMARFMKDTNTAQQIYFCPTTGRRPSPARAGYSGHPSLFSVDAASRHKASLLKRPGETLLAVDGTIGAGTDAELTASALQPFVSRPFVNVAPSWVNPVAGSGGTGGQPAPVTPLLPATVFAYTETAGMGRISLRHPGGRRAVANVLFADTHAETMTEGTMREQHVSIAY